MFGKFLRFICYIGLIVFLLGTVLPTFGIDFNYVTVAAVVLIAWLVSRLRY